MPPKGKKGATKKAGATKGKVLRELRVFIDAEENEYQEVPSQVAPDSIPEV
jgi:hypothetical protein